MQEKLKENIKLIIAIALVLILVIHLDKVGLVLTYIGGILFPVIIGGILAFVLNVPMRGFGHLIDKLCTKTKWNLSERARANTSLALTIISVLLILTGVIGIIVPNLIASVTSAVAVVENKLPDVLKWLSSYGIDTKSISELLAKIDDGELWSSIGGSAGNIMTSVFQVASSTISTAISISVGVIVAIYLLADKKRLGLQSKKMIYAYFNEKIAKKICDVGLLINEKYGKFLSGQCVEAVILGSLMFIFLSIGRVPYASVIAVLTGVFSLIPLIGSFLACLTGAVLIVLINPIQAVVEIVIFLVVQFVEGQFIYPRVVGNSVGLPPLFTLLAAFLGGELLGLPGMIFFIPLTAVVYELVRKNMNDRLKEKKTKL